MPAQFPRLPPWIRQNASAEFARQSMAGLANTFIKGVQLGQEQRKMQDARKELKALKRDMGGFLEGLSKGDLEAAAEHSDVFTNQNTAGPASQALTAFMRNQRVQKQLEAANQEQQLSQVQQAFMNQTLQGLQDPRLPDQVKTQALQFLNQNKPFEAMKFLQTHKPEGIIQPQVEPETFSKTQRDIFSELRKFRNQTFAPEELQKMSTRELWNRAGNLARESLQLRESPPSKNELRQSFQELQKELEKERQQTQTNQQAPETSQQQAQQEEEGSGIGDFFGRVLQTFKATMGLSTGGFGQKVEPKLKIERDEKGNLKLPE